MSEINELFAKCDGWHAKEWFERLVKAVDSRNEAVRSGDEIAFATHNNIASSSASRLAMEFRDEIRAALSSAAVAEREPAYWAVHSKTGMHIGLWQHKSDADEALRGYEGGTIAALYLDPPPVSELEAENARLERDALKVGDQMLAEKFRADNLEARLAEAMKEIRWAHETLYEINPSNYDHDEVCKLNSASVEVILGLALMLGEKHGKPDAWWADLAARRVREGGKVE